MKLNKKTRNYLTIGLAGILILAFFSVMLPLEVLSVDRIWLEQRGVGEAGQELTGGSWRVTATSSDTKVRFLKLNEDEMKIHEEYNTDFPEDVQVNGEIYVTVSQPYNPYWVFPVKHLGNIEVVPNMQAVSLSSKGFSGDVKAESESVSLWTLDLSQKKVVTTFEVSASKLSGENTGFLTTDDSRAKKITTSDGAITFQFSISQSDITDGELSKIVFYNPTAPEETLKITLQWTFGDYDKYSWNTNFLFITPANAEDITPQTEICFYGSDEYAIRNELNWQSSSDWTFNHYWYGGGGVFKGTTAEYSLIGGVRETTETINELGGKSLALITPDDSGSTITGPTSSFLAEGYVTPSFWSGDPKTVSTYEYPGWYVPKSGCVENPSVNVDNYDEWRYPISPNILTNTESQPNGLSILNYLTSSVKAPVTGYVHTPFSRVNPDVWGYGCGGYVDEQVGVVLPTAARTWLFTLDVSTELADTVVVREDYIDVSISKQLTFDKTTLNVAETATGTIKLKNNSPYSGVVSLNIKVPDNLAYTTTVSGTSGSMQFAANEEKTVTIQVTNTGILREQQSGTFVLTVTNQEPRETARQTFTMTFKPGIGIPDTILDVTVKDFDTQAKLSGININVNFGVDGEYSKSGSTTNGECSLNLGTYDGSVTVIARDYAGNYETTETTTQVVAGSNALTVHMVPVGSAVPPDVDWEFLLTVFGVGSMCLLAIYLWRRKR